jgi:molybdenum cofactor biosynthesis protein B
LQLEEITRGRSVIDDVEAVREQMRAWIADPTVDIVDSTGGTGFTQRDVLPEAVMPLLRRVMDGFSVVFHQASMGTIGVSAMQSRVFWGQAGAASSFLSPIYGGLRRCVARLTRA